MNHPKSHGTYYCCSVCHSMPVIGFYTDGTGNPSGMTLSCCQAEIKQPFFVKDKPSTLKQLIDKWNIEQLKLLNGDEIGF